MVVLVWHKTSVTGAMKAIETKAYGHRFRSRLEAKWAVAFTEARIEWQYEPEGFDLGDAGLYLPDFWLPQVSMWAEVKPGRPTDQELQKVESLVRQSSNPCLLLIGPPASYAYWAIEPEPFHDEPELDELGIIDYCPFEGSDYHLSESRFFASCGAAGVFPMPFDPGWDYSHPAVEAALSARFEHGESPR